MAVHGFDKVSTEILYHMEGTTLEFRAVMQDILDILFQKGILDRTGSFEENLKAFENFIGPAGLAGFHGFLQITAMSGEARRSKPPMSRSALSR